MSVINHPQAYILGQMTVTRNDPTAYADKATIELNYNVVSNMGTDHMQLIYEALEIAAASKDKFAPQFRAMCDEWLALTADWDN